MHAPSTHGPKRKDDTPQCVAQGDMERAAPRDSGLRVLWGVVGEGRLQYFSSGVVGGIARR